MKTQSKSNKNLKILMLNTENFMFSVPFNFDKVEGYEFPPLGGGASPVSYEIAKSYAKLGHKQ